MSAVLLLKYKSRIAKKERKYLKGYSLRYSNSPELRDQAPASVTEGVLRTYFFNFFDIEFHLFTSFLFGEHFYKFFHMSVASPTKALPAN